MKFEKSADTKVIESVLAEAKIGDTITYETLSKAIGRDVRQFASGALNSARRTMLNEKGMVFGTENNVGLKRLDDSQIVNASEDDRRKMHRMSNRAIRKLGCVNFDGLSKENKQKHLTASAQFGALQMFSTASTNKKIEQKVEEKTMPVGDVLKLFV